MTEFVPITRYSRCKRYSGTLIKCPECHTITTTGHLSWTIKRCQNCQKDINKVFAVNTSNKSILF